MHSQWITSLKLLQMNAYCCHFYIQNDLLHLSLWNLSNAKYWEAWMEWIPLPSTHINSFSPIIYMSFLWKMLSELLCIFYSNHQNESWWRGSHLMQIFILCVPPCTILCHFPFFFFSYGDGDIIWYIVLKSLYFPWLTFNIIQDSMH